MGDEEKADPIGPEFPTSRIKKIVKLDKEINKVNSESLFLISCSTDLFLRFLAEKSAEVSTEKKRKTVNLEDLRLAVKRHRPTRDFLLDELPAPIESTQPTETDGAPSRSTADRPAPAGTRRIDQFFSKAGNEPQVQIIDA